MPNNDKQILSREEIAEYIESTQGFDFPVRLQAFTSPAINISEVLRSHLAALDEMQRLRSRQLPEGWEPASSPPEPLAECYLLTDDGFNITQISGKRGPRVGWFDDAGQEIPCHVIAYRRKDR